MAENLKRKKYWKLRILLVIGIIVALVLPIYFSGRIGPIESKRARLANDFNQMQTAVLAYYTEYSEYPVVPDNASLIKKLIQDNPRGIAFLAVKADDQNARGEMLDPWGMPLRISVDANGVLHMRSAGPDKIFGTADDISNQ